mgnify:CR=1 FL=1
MPFVESLCIVGKALELEQGGPEAARDWALAQIRSILFPGLEPQGTPAMNGWSKMEGFSGSASYPAPGFASARKALSAPTGRILWAGEATSVDNATSVNGAITEGQRAAREAIKLLTQESRRN